MAKKIKKTPVETAFEHLRDVSNRAHSQMILLTAELHIAEREGNPDLESALKKMIAYEVKTQDALLTIGAWYQHQCAVSAAVRKVGGTLNAQRSTLK